MKRRLVTITSLVLLAPLSPMAGEGIGYVANLRGEVPLAEADAPPRMEQPENDDVKRRRNYPMQPPTIPHEIDNYQVDLNTNRCMDCHSRREVEATQAPGVSVTHYMDRDGNFLAEVSPRRYFCTQCHVVQTNARPLVSNTFEDVGTMLERLGSER